MQPYEEFAEVYSISDLHLAEGDFVDSVATEALGSTIQALTGRAKALEPGRAALVVNGDSVDFLSLEPADYFDPAGAPEKLKRVFKANVGVWNALKTFAEIGTVVFTLGNHDVELALPHCQAMLRKRIGGSLILAFDGSGYRCVVGRANALFLHGNNEDGWNLVDYDRLGHVAAAVNAGTTPERWDPNNGTQLVVEVLNVQKKSHPFIDYVKPESRWLGELIAKLGFGSLLSQLGEFAPRRLKMQRDHRAWRNSTRAAYLGKDAEARGGGALFDGDALLRTADQLYRQGTRVLGTETSSGSLGAGDLIRTKRAAPEEIRKHIQASLVGNTCFLIDQIDEVYESLEPKLGREIHWVVCGHTHLRRAKTRRSDRVYFNSGTWMRLIDLYAPSAHSEAAFLKVMEALDAATNDALDKITWHDGNADVPMVNRELTVVVLSAKDHKGWLEQWEGNALVLVKNSEREVRP